MDIGFNTEWKREIASPEEARQLAGIKSRR